MPRKYTALLLLCFFVVANRLYAQQKTYCNPINVDYGYTPIPNFTEGGKHRATADPVIVLYKGDYYLFSTNQWGYWWSKDMLHWNFVSRRFLLHPRHDGIYDDLCAPAAWVMNDTLYLVGSSHANNFPIWKSGNPKKDDWQIAVDSFSVGAWDPAFFYDQDLHKLFLYWNSSNEFPIIGVAVNPQTLRTEGVINPLIKLHDDDHGWERFGEHNDNVFLKPFIEGAWMNKFKGTYYLQYGAPGTEFSGYGDGVYTSKQPLEKFEYQSHNPFSYKPGGFARGAGHGATYQDVFAHWWHVSTIAIGVKNNFERRIGIWPSGIDSSGILYTNTAYGDYPTFLPTANQNHSGKQMFAGWMLLNYAKPVMASSTLGAYHENFAVDEDIKTYWSAKTGNAGEWFQTDLGEVSTVQAIQVNFADHDVRFYGKSLGVFHQYALYASLDGKQWKMVVDKRNNQTDVPHDYIELDRPIQARYIKIENKTMPTGTFALSGLRVFGKGSGKAPSPVNNLIPLRTSPSRAGERRAIWLKWVGQDDADGYVIYFGKSPEKMYGSIMVYGKNEYEFTAADRADGYYFSIEAFNNNGISAPTRAVFSE